MNKQDRKLIDRYRLAFNRISDRIFKESQHGVSSLDSNTQSINALRDEVHETAPRYDKIINEIKSLKIRSDKIRSFEDLTVEEMSKYIKNLASWEVQTLKRYFPDDPEHIEDPPEFVKSETITGGPITSGDVTFDIQAQTFTRRITDRVRKIDNDQKSKSKILNFFGIGRLKVEV